MKISVSLPVVDVEILDAYAHAHGVASRSAALQRAIGLLREAELADAYEQAWDEWDAGGEAELWEPATADGLPSR
ncbi:antitoxin [Microlunatus spumicola]|uniref:antitoxin n=1 Tax=Microlunatus spumicola TaxID=81499 RepID=UPI00195E8CD1